MSAATVPEQDGLEQDIAAYLAHQLGAREWRIASFRRSVEGFSWETYAIGLAWIAADGEHEERFIVHRVPKAGLLRPYHPRTLFELRRAVAEIDAVPMPASLWLDEEGTATGRPLYVVAHVDGVVPTQWATDGFFADEAARRDVARELMGIAAALHAAPVSLAPADLRGAPQQDPLAEVRHWFDVYTNERLGPEPVLDLGFAWLFEHSRDVSERLSVLHGDLRTGNYILDDGHIVALLDWEESHVGDPVQDLAHCALRLFRGRLRQPSGLVPLPDLLALYEEAAGWEVPRPAFHFWTVFESVYTAITQHRAASFFAAGETDDVRYAALGTQAHHNHRYVIDAIESADHGEALR
jgi:aminoglycoside phosphotransferase (APT) family kinase protein